MEASQRGHRAPKAWGRDSPNPITGRKNATANGIQASNKDSVLANLPIPANADDIFAAMAVNCIGNPATVLTKTGDQFTGIFSSASLDEPEMRYALKMVKKVASHAQVNGVTDNDDEYVGIGDDHLMVFMIQDIVDLKVSNVRMETSANEAANGVLSSFRTDGDISGNRAGRERDLQKWEPSADTAVSMSLDDNSRGWDQFEVNERLYGVQSDYDESFYTTIIDKSNPRYKEIEAKAARIAREIESSNAMNAHVAEERGLKPLDDSGLDEEMKYSGVSRNNDFPPLPTGQPNKYTPPARRPPTGQSSVPGVPVDPAIISSSLARSPPNQSANEGGLPNRSQAATRESSKPVTNATSQNKQEATKKDVNSVIDAAPAVTNAPKVSPTATASNDKTISKEGGAAATVEKDVYNAFKQFNQGEKMRIIEQQRNKAHHNKTVKLNDLKKFAENFKLHTPVPQDLVPILAKEKSKQDEIVQKALQQVQEVKSTPPKQPASTTTTEQKPTKPAAPRNEVGLSSPQTPQDRQQGQQRSRPNQPNFSQSVRGDRPYQNQFPPRQGPGHLSQRLNITTQQHRAGMASLANMQQPTPIDPRIPPSGPSAPSSGVQSPTGSSRFNVRAMEFHPNPAANTFQPSSNPSTGSSPVRAPSARPTELRPPKKSNYLAGKTKKQNMDIDPALEYNPIRRMERELAEQGKQGEWKDNGGIPNAYRTNPTWDIPAENQDKSYDDIFEAQVPPAVLPQPRVGQSPMPHQHQLPVHLQQSGPPMSQVQTPQQTPRNYHVQPHHGGPHGPPHMDDHRMQYSTSTASMHPSPRAMPNYLAFAGQPPPGVAIYGQPIPTYGMNPGGHPMAVRQVSSGPQGFMGPQGPGFGGGQMMANQASSGPYMNVPMTPQMQMYSPMPAQVYPHHAGSMPPQSGVNGYPSPRPPTTMMAQQGSQQGHPPNPIMYMAPGQGPTMLAQSPAGQLVSTPMRGGPQFHTPAHFQQPHPHFSQGPHRGTPSATYVHPMMPVHGLAPVPQGMAPTGPSPMGNDGSDGVK